MPPHVSLITDSTCDIPFELRSKYDIQIVPLTVIFGDQQFLDGVEMTAEQFYDRLPLDTRHPTTSQPTPQDFLNAFKRAADGGADEIITITISGGLSGTVESARRAAEDSPIPVHVIDSKNTSMGLGYQVLAAARAQEAGGGLQEMLAAIEMVHRNMVFFLSLDTIEYLARGGRISEAARFLDSILHIKPLVFVNQDSGTVGASIPSRSRKGALQGLQKEFFRHMIPNPNMHLAVMHTQARQEAEELAELVRREYSPQEIVVGIGSPVLGVHVGLRAIALCGYSG